MVVIFHMNPNTIVASSSVNPVPFFASLSIKQLFYTGSDNKVLCL